MSSQTSGNLALHNERFCLERIVTFFDLAQKTINWQYTTVLLHVSITQ